jgi:glycosyltransferase involved in cell wall biosynthesis
MFQYAVEMDVSRPIEIADKTVELACMFRHFNRAPIQFGAENSAQTINLGFKLFQSRAKTLVHEGRLKPHVPTASPEQWLPFALEIPSQVLVEDEEFEILVDLVLEDGFWFHERGHHGSRFRVRFVERRPQATDAQAPIVLTPRRADHPADPPHFGAGFEDMLKEFAFADYAAITRLERDDATTSLRPSLPSDILEIFNAPRQLTHDRRLPLTGLMDYTMRTRQLDVDRMIGKRTGRFELIRRFFEISQQLAGEPTDYFPAELAEDLNTFVLFDGLFEVPLSRLMLWFWLSEERRISPSMAFEREAIYWWWVTGAMPANHVPDLFIPEPVIAHLSGSHESYRGRVVELSRFAHRAHAESEQLRLRYDLKTAPGLIAYSFDFIIHNARNKINRHFIGSAARAYWDESFPLAGERFTRFELAVLAQLPRFKLLVTSLGQSGSAQEARRFLNTKIPRIAPEWQPFCRVGREPAKAGRLPAPLRQKAAQAVAGAQPSILVAGLVGSPSGLGVNLKMSCQTFESLGLPMGIYDTPRRRFANAAEAERAEATLFHVNADMLGEVLATDTSALLGARRRIGFFLWELDVLPQTHLFGADLVDEIWAPSEFVASVYAEATNKPVKLVKKFIVMPEIGPAPPVTADRPYRFLTSFDFHSGVERKNPYAVIKAFQAAFPTTVKDVRLTVKTTEFVPGHWGDANNQWFLINEAAARDPRIDLIVDAMPEREFFALIRDHDCIVSSHRAEGFGYLPAYGMSFGKPVIVTDYSGTQDFCTPRTSYPVSHRLIPVRPHEFIVEVPGAQWADIDMEHLTETMRSVFDNRAEAKRRGEQARRFIREEYSLAAHAARYKEAMTAVE